MRKILLITAVCLTGLSVCMAHVQVLDVKGDVRARHGVDQEWLPVHRGDFLKPEDSMKTGPGSSVTILIDGTKRVVLPENVIVDLSDFRLLTQEEFLLKLAMERVRNVPDDGDGSSPVTPRTTVLHGTEKSPAAPASRSTETGMFQLNGTRVLYRDRYYATCALKAKEILRLYPEFAGRVDIRLMIASSLEKENLLGEALTEYGVLSQENLLAREKALVLERIAGLKKKQS